MARVADIFPKLRACVSSTLQTTGWNRTVSFDQRTDIEFVLNIIQDSAQSAIGQRSPDLLDIPTALVADLDDQLSSQAIPGEVAMLIRMVAVSIALDCATHRKQLSVTRDWLLYSIIGRFETANRVELDSISSPALALQQTSPVTFGFTRIPFLIWSWNLFYYSRTTGDLSGVAEGYLDLVDKICSEKLDALAIETLAMAATWAMVKGDTRGPAILRKVADIYQKSQLPPETSVTIAITLSGGPGAKIGLDTISIAERALRESVDSTTPVTYRLQLLSNACGGNIDRILRSFDQVLAVVKEYSSEVDRQSGGSLLGGFERDRSFGIVAPLVGTLAVEGHVSDAMRLVSEWHGTGATPTLPKVMILLTNWHKGVSYCVEGRHAIFNHANVSDTLLALTQAGNAFFGTNLIIRDDDRFEAHDSSRPGIPDGTAETSKRFEDAIVSHFGFEIAAERIGEPSLAGMVPIPGVREPLQASMLKTLGRTLPILTSCTEPHSDRSIRKVCIWLASTLYGELERNWLTEIFERRNIEIVPTPDKTSSGFRSVYSMMDLDLFWIIGHGQVNHYYQERLFIDLSEEQTLDLAEWATVDLPEMDGRRLVVANLCDSGTTAVLGGIGEIGLPKVLAQSAQALIAHLWPVSSMHSGIFGVVLAIQLCKSDSFFEAYCHAVVVMISGKARIEEVLVGEFGHGHEVVDRLVGAVDIWRDIFVWGSPAFFA